MPTRIGIVIPTFNRNVSLQECLLCLNEQKLDSEIHLLKIVVVDGSTDGTYEMLANCFPEAIVISGNGNWWYTKCINEGIKKAKEINCEFVLTLNDDVTFKANYINALLTDYYKSDKNTIIGSISLSSSEPRLITFSGVRKINFGLREFNYIKKYTIVSEESLSGLKASVVLSGRGILYPIGVLEKFGLYDENLVQYSSETDFTFNAFKKKVKVMISYNAKVYEEIELTSAGSVYNKPTIKSFFASFKNKYSINSIEKTFYYCIKHKGIIQGSIISIIRLMGIVKNFILLRLKN